MAATLTISGDGTSDGCVAVELGGLRSLGGRMTLGAGTTMAEATLPDVPVEIPITIEHDGVPVRDEIVHLTLRDAAIRVPLDPPAHDFDALLVGAFTLEEIVPAYAASDPAFLSEMLIDRIAASQADLSPDAAGNCQRVSAAFTLRGRWSP